MDKKNRLFLTCLVGCVLGTSLVACSEDEVIGDPIKDISNTTEAYASVDDKGFSTYYTPVMGRVGDPMPFYDKKSGSFKVLYLQEYDDNAPVCFHPIWAVETTDGCNYRSLGEILPIGESDYQQDSCAGYRLLLLQRERWSLLYLLHRT